MIDVVKRDGTPIGRMDIEVKSFVSELLFMEPRWERLSGNGIRSLRRDPNLAAWTGDDESLEAAKMHRTFIPVG